MKTMGFVWTVSWRMMIVMYMLYAFLAALEKITGMVLIGGYKMSTFVVAVNLIIFYLSLFLAVKWAEKTSYSFKNYIENVEIKI